MIDFDVVTGPGPRDKPREHTIERPHPPTRDGKPDPGSRKEDPGVNALRPSARVPSARGSG